MTFIINFDKNLKKNDTELLFTATDSLTYEIKSKDACEEFFNYKHLFDFSEFKSKFFDSTNRKSYWQNER